LIIVFAFQLLAQDGVAAAEIITRESGIPTIFTTSYSKLELTKRAREIKSAGYFNKPVSAEDLKTSLAISILSNGSFTRYSAFSSSISELAISS